MGLQNIDGVWVGPDGAQRPVRYKGGALFDAFHGITRVTERELGASKADLARAYASAVWAYRCIKLRADAAAGVPLVLKDRDGSPIYSHPLLSLLAENRLSDLLRATEAAYNIFGLAYWLKTFRGEAGGGDARQPVRWLTWLNPQTIEAEVESKQGVVGYRQSLGGETQHYAPGEVMVFRNFNPLDDLGGLSPLSVALSEVNAELNASRFVAAFFANDARPAGLLTTEQPLVETEAERVRTWWQRLFRGASNKWKTGIVGGGLRWQAITFPPQELALRDLREEDRRAICAVFGVPSALAGAWEAATYATAREQKASFYEDTIIPQLGYIAGVLNTSLVPHYPDLVAKDAALSFDIDSIEALGESATEKAERLAMLFGTGVITRNEVRSEMGLPPVVDEADGFVFDVQSDDSIGAGHDVLSTENNDPIDLLDNAPMLSQNGHKGTRVKSLTPEQIEELNRWKRFAVRRIREGRRLRPFRTTLIPVDVWVAVDDDLREADTAEDVKAIFDAVLNEHAA